MSSNDRFRRLEALFHELDEMEPEVRARRLAEIAEQDADLHAELAAMLEPSSGLTRDEQRLDHVAGKGGIAARLAESGDPVRIGPYTLRRPLGEGGMGRVYLAEQSEPVRRTVALKLTRGGFDSAEADARFQAERQALAVLDHPNIARVFDAGSTADGRPWFAMEYIEGVPITHWCDEHNLGLAERIRLLLPVCDAVQHAHRKGLIHRDLKPSNILVVDDGELGFPKVIDFGIARAIGVELDARSNVTQLGELVGTPEYMSPEQAALGEIDIDTRSDVYSLGLVLYELLVGAPPVTGSELRALGFEAMCRRIREGDTPRPSRVRIGPDPLDSTTARWRSRLKGDLDSVLLKALAKDRERRYGSAAEFADDLRRYLGDQPVQAQSPSLAYRGMKFVRRHRWPVAAGSAVAVALLVGAVLAMFGLNQARDALRQSEASLAEARLLNDISNAYADALQRLFGASGDVEGSTDLLLTHVEERTANWQTDPDSAALTAFAVGRHFLSRNDYPSARKAFEPWLKTDYGPEELKLYGWQLLGFAYRYTGERDLALSAFRTVDRLTPIDQTEHPGSATRRVQIALLSREPEDFDRARDLLERLLGSDEYVGAARTGLLNSRYQLEMRAGDFDAAYQAMRETVKIIDATPNMEFAGRDTNRLNLASLELYHRGDLAAVRRQLETVRSGAMRTKGESREAGRALLIEGVLRRLDGDPATALDRLESAIPIFARFSGATGNDRLHVEMEIIVTLAESGRIQEARARLDQMRSMVESDDDRRLVMAAAHVALAESGPDAASRVLVESGISPESARARDYSRHHLNRLREAGVNWPENG